MVTFKCNSVAVYIVFVNLLFLNMADANTKPQEQRLLDHLFRNYDKRVRPSRSSDEPIDMTFGIAYVQLVELDDKEMTLISNVWIRQIWHNHLLRWDPREFDNITVLTVSPALVWLPDIVLYNNAKSGLGGGTMYQYKTKVIIQHDGIHKWFTPAIIRSGCDVLITYFPFDDQHCQLHFGSWTYPGAELNFDKDRDTADLSFYQNSTEFQLVSANAVRHVYEYACCPNMTYPNVIFNIHIRRMPGFFLFNVIIPSMVITFFAILTFISPPFIGERIALAIESFLSLSFLCMMVADSIPVNSDVSPLITQFLMTCMTLISAALVFNMVSMNLASSHPVPEWIRKVAFVYIGPFVGLTGGMKLRDSADREIISQPESSQDLPRRRFSPHLPLNTLHLRNKPTNKTTIAKSFRKTLMRQHNSTMNTSNSSDGYTGDDDLSTPVDMYREKYAKVKENMKDIVARSTGETDDKVNKDFWRCIAQTIDRICLLSFTIGFIFLSAVMLIRGYGHQLTVERDSVK